MRVQTQNSWASAVKPDRPRQEVSWKYQPSPFPFCEMGDKNAHLSDSTLKPTARDAEATCAATAIETTEMYLQMERISEILTQEEETK